MQVSGANVLVVGMARSGLAAVELLREKGAVVRATDMNAQPPARLLDMGVPFRPQSEEDFRGCDLIVLSPGVPADLEPIEVARAAGIRVVGDVEMASWFLQGEIIGVTGANGKTTTTAMVGHILRESGIPVQVGGNIGTPVAAMVASSRPEQWNVLELSSFQLETIDRFRARVGIAMNVTPDHLDRHRTFERYAAAKGRLFETQQEGDFAVLNADDPTCVAYASLTKGRTVWFSSTRAVDPGLWLERGRILFDDDVLMEAREVPLRGVHNLENTMAAAGASRIAGANHNQIAAAVRSFPGVEHRLEYVRTIGGVDFYNDSKATNVDATLKAIAAFDSPLWIILGGKDKDSDYTVLAEPLRKKARAVLLIGAAADKIARQLDGAARLIACGTIETAVTKAFQMATQGDTVLLAPACASFDQFDNFEHRGRVFKMLVHDLLER